MRGHDVAVQEVAGEREARENLRGCRRGIDAENEARQPEQPVGEGRAGLARNGPPGLRRDVDELDLRAGAEIEAEA